MSMRILVAGIGNIFNGDDAFGVETVRQLSRLPLPKGVRVGDFGIRSYDLAYAIMDGYDAVILVDATQRGQAPGTVYLLEPDLDIPEDFALESTNAHELNPLGVLQMVQALGGKPNGPVYLVGCEPETMEPEDGNLGLSATVQAAVPAAIEMIQLLVENLIRDHQEPGFLKTPNEESIACATPKKS